MNLIIRKKTLLIIVIVLVIVLGAAWFWLLNPANQGYVGFNMRPVWDVADNIKNGSENRIFAGEMNKVGYYTFLHGKGPFTVFVPTDKAYSNLPVDDQDILGTDEGSLRQVLLYNVVKGKYRAEDLKDGMTLHTVQGQDISVARKGNNIILNGYSYIETTDVNSSNGVIHMTTNYLIPPNMMQ